MYRLKFASQLVGHRPIDPLWNKILSVAIPQPSRRLSTAFIRKCSLTPVMAAVHVGMNFRGLSSQDITGNMQLVTKEKRYISKNPKTLKLNQAAVGGRPLVIILSWLLSRQKHVNKYAALYLDQGFDVLTVSMTPWQLLWPVKGSQLVALDLMKFLCANDDYNTLFLHGFSVGGYLWGECLVHVACDMDRYTPVLNRITGQVWDSAADITEIPIGVPKALFPKNAVLQAALRKYMIYHLKSFNDSATTHYIRSSQMFHSNLARAPALFLLSKSDPVGAESSNRRVCDSWDSLGVKTYWKCWDRSPHVGHFHKHPEEYRHELECFMESLSLVTYPKKIRTKI